MVKSPKPDPLTKLRDARLKPYFVNMVNKTYNTANNILRNIRRNWFNRMIDSDIPINYFVLVYDKSFQYATPLFNHLWNYYVYANKGGIQLDKSSIMNDFDQPDCFADYIETTLKTDKNICEFLKYHHVPT